VADVPRGDDRPATFGNGETTGLWFMSVNVVRDLLSLTRREASPWDTWRLARVPGEILSDETVELCDRLAAIAESGDEAGLVARQEVGIREPP